MRIAVVILIAWALIWPTAADASLITVDASGRGALATLVNTDNGNTATNSYEAGSLLLTAQDLARNHFDFSIPTLNGTLVGATLSLDNPVHSINTVANTYTVYSLGAYGTYTFSDIGTGTAYGSASPSTAGTVTIALNAAALAAIVAAQGGTFSLGGVDSGENSVGGRYDFVNSSGASNVTSLTLDLLPNATTPEPATLALLGTGLLAIGGVGACQRRRTRTPR